MTRNAVRCGGLLGAVAGLMLGSALSARAEGEGFYFNGSLGGSFAEKVDVKEFLGALSNVRVKLDPGVHVGAAAGYNFTHWFGVELETGILANNIDKLGTSSPDAALSHVPLMANVMLRYDTGSLPVIPYIGAGIGGDSSILVIDDSLGVDGADADLVFAYQFMAGLRYRINDRMSAGLGYKFYHADGGSWEVERSSGRIRFGEATVHALSAVFNWRF